MYEHLFLADSDIKMDKSWMGAKRNTQTYINGATTFWKYAVQNYKISNNINPLDNKKKDKKIHVHMITFTHGIDQTYTNWTNHGEKEEPPRNTFIEEDFAIDTSFIFESTDFTTG
ncbi:hypothetical protein LXL04_004314 [Taraxacum kok-saghyz]